MTAGRPKTRTTDTHRICNVCGVTKLIEEFSSFRVYSCRICTNLKAKEYYLAKGKLSYEKNREDRNKKACEQNRVRKYGVDPSQFDLLVKKTGGVCPGCLTDSTKFGGKWHLDHCDTTGKVRGVLCARCNMTLRLVNDDQKTLHRLISYLKVAS